MDQSVTLWALQALLGAFCVVLWTNFKEVKQLAERNAQAHADYKTLVAEKYVTGDEHRRSTQAITEALELYSAKLDVRFDRLESKLDKKADRTTP